MDLQVHIKMNSTLYIRDPEQSELGKKIIKSSIVMINELGFEDFTFKKLATEIHTTEASIYRYFENKHRLLTYITTWFWTWLEYQLVFYTNNINDPLKKIDIIVNLITFQLDDKFLAEYIDKEQLHLIAIAESNKSYYTKHVDEDNKAKIFKPYKDLCHNISTIFSEYAPSYPYPHSLASSLLETAHHQIFFKAHLPSLTDFGKDKELKNLTKFLNHMILSTLKNS